MRFLTILVLVAIVFYLSGCGLFKTKTKTSTMSSCSHSVSDSANVMQNDSLRAKINTETDIASIETGLFGTTLYFTPNTRTKFNPDGSFEGTVDSAKTTGETNKQAKAKAKTNADVSAGSKTNAKQGYREEATQTESEEKSKSKPPNWLIISLALIAIIVLVSLFFKLKK